MTAIERPKFVTVELADGLKWRGGGGWRYEEKMDGVWEVSSFKFEGRSEDILCGERMRDGRFFAFDILQFMGMDTRPLPLIERVALLDSLVDRKSHIVNILRPACGQGGEFLEAVLSRGGEGVVAKRLDAPYGDAWHKCKRVQTFDLVVVEKVWPSIRLATAQGEDRGWCAARAAYADIKPGDIVEIAAYAVTANGKLREPRFVRIRPDKHPDTSI